MRDFSVESKHAPYESWESVFRNCYVKDKKHRFPELDTFISDALSLNNSDKIHDLFRKINDNLRKGNILFGLAFNDPDDIEPFFPLDTFDLMPQSKIKYKPNPQRGVKNLGYFEIENEKILNIVCEK